MVLWGPPGVGKTTLARLLADAVGLAFEVLSAIMSGVTDVRAAIARARDWIDRGGTSTVLFIDEIHRFNKAQQDALLPQVEDGVVTLIGATTENPYFEVNSALLSRLRVFRLEPLSDDERRHASCGARSRTHVDTGAGSSSAEAALEHLVAISAGDARAGAQHPRVRRGDGRRGTTEDDAQPVSPTLEDIEAAAQQRVLAYDRAGDGHYGTVSAFIKVVRGNDPDAALYWLATMVAAGEDPKFIARGSSSPPARTWAMPIRARSRWPWPRRRRSTGWACPRPVRPGAGHRLRRHGAQVEPRRPGVLGGHGRRPASTARSRCRSTCSTRRIGAMRSHGIGVGYRLPARLRGRRRGAAVPAGRTRGPPLLRALGPGMGAAHPRANGRAHGGPQAGSRKRTRQLEAPQADHRRIIRQAVRCRLCRRPGTAYRVRPVTRGLHQARRQCDTPVRAGGEDARLTLWPPELRGATGGPDPRERKGGSVMRHILSTALVALIVGGIAGATVGAVAQTDQTPAAPAAVSAINADRVDGRHAVGAGASKAARAGKLVATDQHGYLPSNIVKPSGVTAISVTNILGAPVSTRPGALGARPPAARPGARPSREGSRSQAMTSGSRTPTEAAPTAGGSWDGTTGPRLRTSMPMPSACRCSPRGPSSVTSRGKVRVAKD